MVLGGVAVSYERGTPVDTAALGSGLESTVWCPRQATIGNFHTVDFEMGGSINAGEHQCGEASLAPNRRNRVGLENRATTPQQCGIGLTKNA